MSNPEEQMQHPEIFIEEISEDKLHINVNGQIRDIKNELGELKSLLQDVKADTFKSGNKIYNIGQITNAVFTEEIGKKAFNLLLYRQLTEAIKEYNPDAKSFLDKLKEADKANWETQNRYTDKAKLYIVSSFVGVIGILLRKLFASGKDAPVSGEYKDYHDVCIATATRTLQLICYAFISSYWDNLKTREIALTKEQKASFDVFFTGDVEANIIEHVEFLNMLVTIFKEQKLEYPFVELQGLEDIFIMNSNFYKACTELQMVSNKVDNGEYNLSTAFKAEAALAEMLVTLKFLASYKMVSVKDIIYEEVRHSAAQYLHAYNLLGGDYEKKSIPKFKYDKNPMSTYAIILFKNKYLEGLNLFPFVIDVTALNDESEVKICFYSYFEENRSKNTKNIMYSYIDEVSSGTGERESGGRSLVSITYNDELEKNIISSVDMDITWLKEDRKKIYAMKSNEVYKTFQQAKSVILK